MRAEHLRNRSIQDGQGNASRRCQKSARSTETSLEVTTVPISCCHQGEIAHLETRSQGWCCSSKYDLPRRNTGYGPKDTIACITVLPKSIIYQPDFNDSTFLYRWQRQPIRNQEDTSPREFRFSYGIFYYLHSAPRLRIKRNLAITQVGEKNEMIGITDNKKA